MPEERQITSEKEFLAELCVALGGRVAESLKFKEISSGALDDLEKVTKKAYAMITIYGFNEKVGNVNFHDSTGLQESSFQKPYSEATGKMIDEEVRQLIEGAYDRVFKLLSDHFDLVEKLAEVLLKEETADLKKLQSILGPRLGAD